MAETIIDLKGNVVVADEFRGAVSGDVPSGDILVPEIKSTSESSSVGPGTLTAVIKEILDLIEAGDA